MLAGRDSLAAYAVAQYPWFTIARHHKILFEHLEALERGDFKKLMVFTPPQHGKTSSCSELFPSWCMGRHPWWRTIVVSYAQPRADDFGGRIRYLIDQPYHQGIFAESRLDPDVQAKDDFQLLPVSGHPMGAVRAAGRKASITGLPADCLVGETLIATERGDLSIREITQSLQRPRVLTYNHATGQTEYRRILAAREIPSREIIEIETSGGRTLRCTNDHRIFDRERGYRAASLLVTGAPLLALKAQQDMPALFGAEARRRGVLPEVLSRDPACDGESQLRAVWQGFRASQIRIRETISQRFRRAFFLHTRLHDCISEDYPNGSSHLPWVQLADSQTLRKILRWVSQYLPSRDVGKNWSAASITAAMLRDLFAPLSAAQSSNGILLAGMCEYSAFDSNEGTGKLAFSQRKQCERLVRGDASFDQGQGRFSLRRLWSDDEQEGPFSASSPYRRRSEKQSTRESDTSVLDLSHNAPQVSRDAVALVGGARGARECVYDIQVEGNCNFFANGILVHNCIIIDDPYSDQLEARSEAVKLEVRKLMNTVIDARMHPETRLLLIMTRWDPDDLAGWELSEHPKGWKVLELPAIGTWVSEMDPERAAQHAGKLRVPDEMDGDSLWPERYPRDFMLDKRDRLTRDEWLSVYQQTPTKDGDEFVFQDSWFRTISAAMLISDHSV